MGDRIIVTGARAPIELDRIGSATTIITREDIERRQARYLADVLRSVPGFAISLSGAVGAQTQARVRGGEANHVLVLIDGVRANDPAIGDEFRWEHLTTGNIERVEIVRGPQSALWGSDAIGAVVNVITRSGPGRSRFDGYAESGANGTRNASLNANADAGNWALSGAIESLETDGTNISRTGTEQDGAELVAGSVGLRYLPADGFSFDAAVRAIDASSQLDPVDFVLTGLPTDGNLESNSDSLIGSLGASLSSNQGRVDWRFRAEYYDSKHLNLVENVWDSTTAAERLTLGAQADIHLGDNALTLALEREDTDFEQRGPVVFGDPNQSQDLELMSTIAEYRHLSSAKLSWVLSARHDDYSDFDNALTGKISAAYALTDASRLRASVGTGQKAPTFIERFGFFPLQFAGNVALKPESSLSYELGVDRDWRDGVVSFSATLYRQTLEDEIDGFVFDPDLLQFTAINLPGRSERKGIELAASWLINDSFTLDGNYTFTDATAETDSGAVQRELRRPRHAGGITLTYAPTAGRFDAIVLAEYGGKRSDTFFPPFPNPAEHVVLPDYWLIDFTLQYRATPKLTVFARATNLLDEQYEQVYGYATLGRSGYVGIRVALRDN